MSDDIGIRSTYDGLKPAKCWGHHDEKYDACRSQCKVSQFCKPVTKRRIAGTPPSPPPPPPPKAEPMPEPKPLDYFFEILKGKGDVKFNRKMSNDKCDVQELFNDEGSVCVRFRVVKDGSNRVMIQSSKGKEVVTIDSIKAAEKVLATL